MSEKTRLKPSSASHSATERRPGVSTSQPPPGSSTSSRAVVVWRPRWSFSRTSPTACAERPTSPLTSRDFPTPDAPMSAIVRSGTGERAQALEPDARDRAGDDDVDAGRGRACDLHTVFGIGLVDEVGLREHDDRRRAALERENELAFETPDVRPVVQRLHHEHEVDVRGDHLRPAGPTLARVTPYERRPARERGDDLASLRTRIQSPVATVCPASWARTRSAGGRAPSPSRDRRARPGRRPRRGARRSAAAAAASASSQPRRASARSSAAGIESSVRSHHGHSIVRRRPHAAGRQTCARGRARARVLRRPALRVSSCPIWSQQSKGLLHYMSAAVADAAPFGEIWIARTDGKIACGAVWLPPGAYPRGVRRDLMTNVRGAPAFLRTGRRLAGAFRLLATLDKAHHELGRAALLPRRPRDRSALPALRRGNRGAPAGAGEMRHRRPHRVPRDAEGRQPRVLRAPRIRADPEGRGRGIAAGVDALPPTSVARVGGQASTTSATNFCSWRRLRTSYTPSQ